MIKEGKEHARAMTLSVEERISALAQLGAIMRAIGEASPWPGHVSGLGELEFNELEQEVLRARVSNGWATEQNVRHAFSAWGEAMEPKAIRNWLSAYSELNGRVHSPHTVGMILAGNVPLVGLHDVMCVWLSGHRAKVKCSSQEPGLVPALVAVLDRLVPGTLDQIEFTDDKLADVEAVIATGSNNTARYFEYYFGHLPRIVRKSRVSVAVLDGSETEDELAGLSEDVFRYFGLGCRNVSKVYVPRGFDLDRLFKAFFPWKDVVDHNKYANNYDYARALWLLDQVPFLENGFILMREENALPSSVATLHYAYYDDLAEVTSDLELNASGIQCVVGHGNMLEGVDVVSFGKAQRPALGDYADRVDTMRFLLDLV